MDPNEPPSLKHGIPAPETYLPTTPDWFWWFLVGGIVLVILASLWLAWLLFKAPRRNGALPKKDFYTPAARVLDALREEADHKQVSEIAAQASLAIRTYLAGSKSEPALYETSEEFQARQSALPASVNATLNELSEAKYDRSNIQPARSIELLEKSRVCLDSLRALPAPSTSPPPLPRKSGPVISTRTLMAGVPLGLLIALASLLIHSYQRRDLSNPIAINAFFWAGLSLSTITLIILLITRFSRSRP